MMGAFLLFVFSNSNCRFVFFDLLFDFERRRLGDFLEICVALNSADKTLDGDLDFDFDLDLVLLLDFLGDLLADFLKDLIGDLVIPLSLTL